MLKRCLPTVLVTFAALLPAAALAQAQAESRVWIPGEGQGTVTLFERQNFGGAAITLRQSDGNVRLPWVARSIIAEGTWRLCSDDNGRGRCVTVNNRYPQADRNPGINFAVRSALPQNGNGGGNGGGWGGGGGWNGPVGGQTLRGTQSQYWPAPEINRRRVDACQNGINGNARCAAETADRFCRFAGWRSAQFFQQVTINRRQFLSDVLCTNR